MESTTSCMEVDKVRGQKLVKCSWTKSLGTTAFLISMNSEYSEITRDPRIDLVLNNVDKELIDQKSTLFQLQGNEKQLVFLK